MISFACATAPPRLACDCQRTIAIRAACQNRLSPDSVVARGLLNLFSKPMTFNRPWLRLAARGIRVHGSDESQRIATYRLERNAPLAYLSGYTHFFWRSGAQFYDYLQANPQIRGGWHGCGPGNTFSMIRAAIGEERVRAFLSAEVFRQEVEQ